MMEKCLRKKSENVDPHAEKKIYIKSIHERNFRISNYT